MDVTVDLSQASLGSLADRIDQMADRLQPACDDAAHEVADFAADIARAGAKVDTGRLEASIGTQDVADGVDVVCSAPYAAFAEFGTGLGSAPSSQASLRAMSDAGWVINLKGRGDEGWPYPKADGGWGITHGQSGAGFMGRGADAARDMAADTFAREIREALR